MAMKVDAMAAIANTEAISTEAAWPALIHRRQFSRRGPAAHRGVSVEISRPCEKGLALGLLVHECWKANCACECHRSGH